ncbi:sulfotransferase family protein [Aequorivita antarctica]|uniref:Sulfotransferase n=1 Tax=Aequorivita antarctica TaxID=153266 RepID=A0A5C6YZ20_9FLAO|nr:sulfotransferase [Aequorivita antarctica]TXD72508.1 sulfotransferase [Aequorivita antarctica]SRX75398.1 hypothetical protein AEQU3_02392 [Aequorivita antarctica]
MINVSPFFILANPRSGSSMLRIVCESHSQLCVPPESGFMEWWYPKYKTWQASDNRDQIKINLFVKDILSSKKIETWHLDSEFLFKMIEKENPRNYAEIIALVYISFGLKSNKDLKVWGDKNNYYLHKTILLNKIYPKAKFIHLIRDGRDVATSYMALQELHFSSNYAPKLSHNIEEIAEEWSANNMLLDSFFKTIDKERVIRVHFEDIIKNLKNECIRITNFLKVPYEESMLEYYLLNKKRKIEPQETLDWKKKTLEKPDIKNIGKYKDLLSVKELAVFNTIAQEGLKEFGYE